MGVNTNEKGTKSEAVILATLTRADYTVLVPFGPCRYDLAIDLRDGSGIKTVQCKTGRLLNGCIVWQACSIYALRGERVDYRGQVDYFGVWCPSLPEDAYLVPVEEVGIRTGTLRVDPLKKFAKTSGPYRWAKDYKITSLSSSQD